MSVISISRIQQRRGKKLSDGTGLPQLASGEFGWAIDTQELYIGNGSVSEGAPTVGNTRILTEKDIDNLNSPSSIFSQLTYVYKSSGAITDYYIINGSGYTDGIYNDVPLNWVTNGVLPVSPPIATLIVSGGAVTSVILTFAGIGVSNNAIFDDGTAIGNNIIGPGTGFSFHVSAVTNSTGSAITKAVKRSMQGRLDDRVNTTDFGTVGDGVVDDTINLQNAIDELFFNSPVSVTSTISATLTQNSNIVSCVSTIDMIGAVVTGTGIAYGTSIVSVVPGVSFTMTTNATASGTNILNLVLAPAHNVDYNTAERAILEIPPGTYRITNTLYIPSYASIVGSGNSSTIIYFDPFLTINGSILSGTRTLNTTGATISMIGASITGSGIPSNTTITSVNPGISITLSANATSNQTSVVFTVTLPANTPVIQFINDLSSIGNLVNTEQSTYINQPRHITFKNLQVSSGLPSQTCLQLDAVRNSHFENVTLTGNWGGIFNENSVGIKLNALSSLVTCQNNIFKNISVSGFSYGVYSNNDIANNTFDNGYMSDLRIGFGLGISSDGVSIGQQTGPKTTKISEYSFNNIKRHAVQVGLGIQNSIIDSNLINVGNDGGSILSPLYPQIFINSYNNIVQNINSDRSQPLSLPISLVQYIPEVAGHTTFNSFGSYKINNLSQSLLDIALFKLPLPTTLSSAPNGVVRYKINYIYTSTTNNYTRSGTLDISLNVTAYTISGVTDYSNIEVTDEYNYTGLEDYNMAIQFKAKLLNNNGLVAQVGTLPYNMAITYSNNLTSDNGYLVYSYNYSFI